jgi:hypothetical protein
VRGTFHYLVREYPAGIEVDKDHIALKNILHVTPFLQLRQAGVSSHDEQPGHLIWADCVNILNARALELANKPQATFMELVFLCEFAISIPDVALVFGSAAPGLVVE